MWGDWCNRGRVGDGASGALQLRVRLASRRIERRILRLDPSAPSWRRPLRGRAAPAAPCSASLPSATTTYGAGRVPRIRLNASLHFFGAGGARRGILPGR